MQKELQIEYKQPSDLCLLVEEAFTNVPYPGDDKIGFIGPHTGTASAEEVQIIFKGKHWKELLQKPNRWFRSHYWVFSSLTPSAYHFFLPAFIIKSVTDEKDLDLVPDWIVYNLIPPPKKYNKSLMPIYVDRMAKFNLKQKRALIIFLKYLMKRHINEKTFVGYINEAISELQSNKGGTHKWVSQR